MVPSGELSRPGAQSRAPVGRMAARSSTILMSDPGRALAPAAVVVGSGSEALLVGDFYDFSL